MVFSLNDNITSTSPTKLVTNTLSVDRLDNFKLLCVHLDPKLSFLCHVQYLCSKLSQLQPFFYKLRHYINKHWSQQLYHKFFASHVNYCYSTWAVASKSALNLITNAQHKAIEIIHNLHYCTPSSHLHKEFSIMDMVSISKYQSAILALK